MLGIALTVYLYRKGIIKVPANLNSAAPSPEDAEQEIRVALKGTKWEPISDFIVAQAKHESANFKSSLYLKNKNPFGMGRPSRRATTDNRKVNTVTEGNVMASYDSVRDATKDLILWLEQFRSNPIDLDKIKSPYRYAQALKSRNYYTDSLSNYYNGLKGWLA